jgi:hypothetical protein
MSSEQLSGTKRDRDQDDTDEKSSIGPITMEDIKKLKQSQKSHEEIFYNKLFDDINEGIIAAAIKHDGIAITKGYHFKTFININISRESLDKYIFSKFPYMQFKFKPFTELVVSRPKLNIESQVIIDVNQNIVMLPYIFLANGITM